LQDPEALKKLLMTQVRARGGTQTLDDEITWSSCPGQVEDGAWLESSETPPV